MGKLSGAGEKAIDLAAAAGLELDPWQQYVLDHGLRRRDDGRWAAFEVALIVARQNGKGAILEARELAGLFLDVNDGFGDERLILHSAHEFKTASEAFRRILALVQDTRMLSRHVKNVHLQRGAEAIELKNGKRLRFVARSSGSGRGFSGDLIILDEAQQLGDEAMAALLPTLSARPNPQVWYTATAGNESSIQLGRVRERGMAGGERSLAFFEWSAEDDEDPADPAVWAKANPGLGIRIDLDYITRERAALGPEGFARERLSIGRYPTDAGDAWKVIPREGWLAAFDPSSEPIQPVAFAAAASGDRAHSAIGVAGRRRDGLLHVEVADYQPGTSWVVPRLEELAAKHGPCAVVIDAAGHEGSFVTPLETAGIEVLSPAPRQVAQAFGQFYEAAVDSGELRHRGDQALGAALGGADTRELAEGRTWHRRASSADISPLVAATLALWGFGERGPSADVGAWVI